MNSPRKGGKTTLLIAASFLFGMILSFVLFKLYIWPTNRAIATWEQPKEMQYNPYGPVYLSVVEGSRDFDGILPQGRRYYIYVGLDSKDPIYGHVMEYTFTPDISGIYQVENYIEKSYVTWNQQGVTFHEADGHFLFIPKESFDSD